MGCGVSSDENPNEIKSNFLPLKVDKFQKLFDTAQALFEPAEEIRSGLQDCRDDLIEFTGVDHLKDESKITVVEAFKVFVWALSANHEGKIEKVKIKLQEEEPYIDVETGNLRIEMGEFKDSFKEWIVACKKCITEAPGMIENAASLSAQTAELLPKVADEAKGANLNPFDSVKEVKNFGTNSGILGSGLNKLKALPDLAKTGLTNFKDLITQLPDIIKNADDIGKKAHKDGKLTLQEIFCTYHPEPKLTDKELEKRQKEQKKAKKKAKKDRKKKKAEEKKH